MLCGKWTIIQQYHGENKLLVNEMIMMSALYYTNKLSLIYIVLAHCNNSPQLDKSLHAGTLSRFRANQSLLLLLSAACLPEKQQIPSFIVFGFTQTGLEPTIYHTQGEHINNYIKSHEMQHPATYNKYHSIL